MGAPYYDKVDIDKMFDIYRKEVFESLDSVNTEINGKVNATENLSLKEPGVYRAETSGTIGSVVVKEGYYTLLRKKDDGSWVLESEVKMPMQDLKPLEDRITANENKIFKIQDITNYSKKVVSNANAVNLTAINNREITINGTLQFITGNFPEMGRLDIFIANNKRVLNLNQFKFNTKKILSVNILKVGENIIDLSHLNITVNKGDYLGVSTSSTSKPYYGIDEDLDFGWFQTSVGVIEGQDTVYTNVDNAMFAFGFEVAENKFYTKEETYSRQEIDTKFYGLSTPYKLNDFSIESSGNALLMNARANVENGTINEIKINVQNKGVVKFQIFERLTNNANSAGEYDDFRATEKIFSINVEKGDNVIKPTNDIVINKGEYLAITGGTDVLTPYSSDSSIGWFQASHGEKEPNSINSLIYQPMSVVFEYTVLFEKFLTKEDLNNTDPIINRITAVKNSENYNSIRNLLKTINDASDSNLYEIFVPKGVWNEYDIQGKKHVKLIGDINGETVLNLDPLGVMADNIVPDDAHFASEIGKKLKDTVQYSRHIVFVTKDIHCENITFEAKYSKYPIHIDSPEFKEAKFINCRIIEDNCNHAIGMGINGGQEVMFDQCIIESKNEGKIGFFYHNWNNQMTGNTVTFSRCKFDNCSYGNVDELGSEHCDFLNVWNCFSTLGIEGQKFNFMVDITTDKKTYWKRPDGQNEPNPINVPYCIVLNTTGTKVSNLTVSDSSSFNPSWAGIPQRDIELIKNLSIIDI